MAAGYAGPIASEIYKVSFQHVLGGSLDFDRITFLLVIFYPRASNHKVNLHCRHVVYFGWQSR